MLTWKGDEARAEILRRAKLARQEIAQRMLNHALAGCPVDTGALKASGFTIDINATTSIVAFPLFYAHFVEFGTVHHGPNPFLRNAVLQAVTDARSILGVR